MIFQEPMSSLNPIYRVGNQIAEAIILHQRLTKKQALARALDLLKEVRIPEPEARLEQYPHQLSGGQRQRVMIAIAIANNPEFLIADEPTTALDVTVQAEILKLIRQLQSAYHMGVLLITHDLTIVEKVSDSVAVMRLGQVVETNATRRLFAAPQNPYTQKLLASAPSGRPNPVAPKSEIVLADRKAARRIPSPLGRHVQPQNPPARRGRRRRASNSGAARRSASSANPAPARRRSARRSCGCIHIDGGAIELEGRAARREDRRRRCGRSARSMQVVFQDPVLLAQSAAVGEADHRGGPDRERHRRQQPRARRSASAARSPMSGSTRTR